MGLQPAHPSLPRLRTRLNGREENEVISYAKILTPSDCADLIFPPLDLSVEPPMYQNLVIKDIFNFAWEFLHVYHGTLPRVLTTGWNRFTPENVVFMPKTSTNEIFIG
ncbi:Hypothetical predicted protein, partial [Olea europaea subsp. europaea]